MRISRDNYETFFLMYVDHELPLHQRSEVELFLELHPDLAEELRLLQETILPAAGTPALPDKSFLRIPENGGIHPGNFTEQALLYIDRELDAPASQALEQYIAGHPHLQRQLALLQQTVLPAEELFYADKAGLYRHEKERRLVPLVWMRMSIAAAITTLIAFSWWMLRPVPSSPGMARQTPLVQPKAAATNESLTGREPAVSATPQLVAATATKPSKRLPETTHSRQQQMPGNLAALPLQSIVAKESLTTQRFAPEETAIAIVQTTAGSEAMESMVTHTPAVAAKAIPALPATQEETPPASYALQQVQYRALNTSEEDQGIYIGALELNKNKLRGFFKKATRLFTAKAKVADDGQLQVANMKINTRQ